MEDPDNVLHTCPEHSARPQAKFLTWDPNRFVGYYVKMMFQEIKTDQKEHLWIKVNCVKDVNTLLGIVNNDPVLNLEVKNGDTVEIPIKDIELFFDGNHIE